MSACRFYVYVLIRPNGEPFYVGMGSGNRMAQHEDFARRGERSHKANVIRSIWAQGHEVGKAIVARFDSDREAKVCERRMITEFGRADLGLGPLINRTDGGDGVTGWSADFRRLHSIRTRAGMAPAEVKDHCRRHMLKLRRTPAFQAARLAGIQKFWSDPANREARAEALREHAKANPDRHAAAVAARNAAQDTPEVREKMRLAKLGKPRDPAAVAKTAAANRGQKRREGTGARISAAKRAAFARRRAEQEARHV